MLNNIILNRDETSIELEIKIKNEIRIHKICDDMLKQSKERKTMLIQFNTYNDNMDNAFRNILSNKLTEYCEDLTDIINNWWNNNTIINMNTDIKKLGIETIYKTFKKSNQHISINIDDFRIKLTSIIKPEYVIKPNAKICQILNHEWKMDMKQLIIKTPLNI